MPLMLRSSVAILPTLQCFPIDHGSLPSVRRFYLQRDEDPSGVSGIGRVAEGVLFSSGWVALQFDPGLKNIETVYSYRSMSDMLTLHGHGGKTKVVWVDDESTVSATV